MEVTEDRRFKGERLKLIFFSSPIDKRVWMLGIAWVAMDVFGEEL